MPSRTNQNNARLAHVCEHEPNSKQLSNRISEHLDALERLLDDPNPKRSFDKLAIRTWGTQIPPEHQSRLEQLTRRVWMSAGTGRGAFEEHLLRLHIVNAGAAALPLLRDAISFTKERDKLSPDRKRWAMMGIAAIAWQLKDRAALDFLSSLLGHDDLRVRTWAVEFVAATHVTEARKLNDECVKALELVAKNDCAFEPRFRARDILTAAGHPTSVEPPGGVYAFKASFGRASRTIEMKSEQLMNELAWAIVDSFGWDSDHLFQFYLSKKLDSPAFKTPREDEFDDLSADEFEFRDAGRRR